VRLGLGVHDGCVHLLLRPAELSRTLVFASSARNAMLIIIAPHEMTAKMRVRDRRMISTGEAR